MNQGSSLLTKPSQSPFRTRLQNALERAGTCLCVGLDPDPLRFPEVVCAANPDVEDQIVSFNAAIINATAGVAASYKLNLAFYELHGERGWRAMERTLALVPEGVITIADAKRGDIGNTARFYAQAFFEAMSFDAITLSPYMGSDSVAPFLEHPDKAVFLLCRTSNRSADDLQLHGGQKPLFLEVASRANHWDSEYAGAAGLVVGATRTADVKAVRAASPTLPLLIPGVGAQGGDAAATVRCGWTTDGAILVNSSRSILYASADEDFAEAAGVEARRLAALLSRPGQPA